MTAGYSAGSVWWGLIDFGDFTGERKKFFVLLNDISDDKDYFVAALTTSQGKRYLGETSAACGCPAASCYRLEKGEEQFEYETWIQYDNTVHFTRANR